MGKKINLALCLILPALAVASPSTATTDWKSVHGATFSCASPSNDADCSDITPSYSGLKNMSAGTKTVIAPVLHDANGNLDLAVYFKTGTRGNSSC